MTQPPTDEGFSRLLRHVRDLIVVSDERGIVLYASPSVEEMLGYTLDEYVGSAGWGYVYPDDIGRLADAFTLA
ncbi:MAG: PAS domain-containing protein, partial [Chloroflexota bacterium]|nr:PAS domain-containing protein [Chloroflexota bacterium]